MICRYLPPNGGGTDAPSTLASWLRTVNWPRSRSCVSFSPSPLQRDQADRQARGVELLHDRRQRARRQAPQIGHRQVRDLVDVGVGAGARLEEHLDDADAGQRPRLHVIDAGAEREEPFEAAGDVGLDLLGRHAVVERRHDDLGMLMSGNRSTGMRTRLVSADHGRRSAQTTMMKYGLRIEKPDISVLPSAAAGLRCSFGVTTVPGFSCARLPTTTRSPARRPLTHLNAIRRLEAERHRRASRIVPSRSTTITVACRRSRSIASIGAISTSCARSSGDRRVGIHARHQFQRRVRHIDFDVASSAYRGRACRRSARPCL